MGDRNSRQKRPPFLYERPVFPEHLSLFPSSTATAALLSSESGLEWKVVRVERSLTAFEEDEMQIQVMGLISLPAVPQSRPDASISSLLRVEID